MNVRNGFKQAKRVMIKVGSNVLTNDHGRLSVGRIGHIVEEIASLVSREGKEVILVSSGAVAVGKRRLEFQKKLSSSILAADNFSTPSSRAAASAGQAAFMAMYEQMFAQFDLMVGNVLLTHADLSSSTHITTFTETIDELLKCSIIPVINENDVTNQKLKDSPAWFIDNDSLSAKLATELKADLLLMLTDVDGVYSAPPGVKGGYLLDYYSPAIDVIKFGEKSSRGRGGMESKIKAAVLASQRGVDVVIASGYTNSIISRLFSGEVLGTVFTENWEMQALTPRQTASKARGAVPELSRIDGETRSHLLYALSSAINNEHNKKAILEANASDLLTADLEPEIEKKYRITEGQLTALSNSLELLSRTDDPVGKVLEHRMITEGLVVQKVTSPVGVVLAVGETPETFLQVVALAIRTGNCLIFFDAASQVRGTFEALFEVVRSTLGSKWPRDALQLHGSEVDLSRLLATNEGLIDIVLPRGSHQLTNKVASMTNIPVLGGPSSVCHVYVDNSAELSKAIDVVLDSKMNSVGPGCYETPSEVAYNAMDTLLIHEGLVTDRRINDIVKTLTDANIKLYGGPTAASTLGMSPSPDVGAEWNNEMVATIEIVSNVQQAVEFINEHGAGIADSIIAEDDDASELFLREVDSACVFKNASTRFADGYRLGIGAETGISTTRVHSRGPAGVSGLLTSRWLTRSDDCHCVVQELNGSWKYIHKNITGPEINEDVPTPATA
eukprot:TRINITY_DN5084_c1_g1_i3.p1 TRINITY_DN5084_c1_g1~~TRINITY_DN5084_c1_g1_i3.p1  ORF type:complete len:730 (+),score=147.77 TRINITY_DN5084_c1_g1_i3:70-2259(+)